MYTTLRSQARDNANRKMQKSEQQSCRASQCFWQLLDVHRHQPWEPHGALTSGLRGKQLGLAAAVAGVGGAVA